jgi:hypothetical protein
MWNVLKLIRKVKGIATTSSPAPLEKLSRFLNDSESPMIANKRKTTRQGSHRKSPITYSPYIGMTAKSHSKIFTRLLYLGENFSGSADNSDQKAVSKRFIFKPPLASFPPDSRKKCLSHFNIAVAEECKIRLLNGEGDVGVRQP